MDSICRWSNYPLQKSIKINRCEWAANEHERRAEGRHSSRPEAASAARGLSVRLGSARLSSPAGNSAMAMIICAPIATQLALRPGRASGRLGGKWARPKCLRPAKVGGTRMMPLEGGGNSETFKQS